MKPSDLLNDIVYIVKKKSIEKYDKKNAKIDDIGGKAVGLCKIPECWTLPFCVVSKELFNEYKVTSNKEELVNSYIPNISTVINELEISENFIIRSSAVDEGMKERGKFYSVKSNTKSFLCDLCNLLEKLTQTDNIGMPIIIQKYISPLIMGHMSNERRLSKENRDWKVELYYNNDNMEFKQDTIGVRTWREKFDIKSITDTHLKATEKTISYALKKAAYYWYLKSKESRHRFHLEFIFDGKTIYFVQADIDSQNPKAINPLNYNVKINSTNLDWTPQILKKYNPEIKTPYKKLNNVHSYNRLGLITVPLYYLDSKVAIEKIKSGIIISELEADLKQLLSIQSIVIRMDIVSEFHNKKQMLPRSNELRDYDTVISWLKAESKNISFSENFIFIFHNFVPAISSAFAHARPYGRVVIIQSLWGLPEGLYYNSHDTIIVDLSSKNLDEITESDLKVTIKNKFKDTFVTPNEDGSWTVESILPPCDWKCSINRKESIFDIAKSSQKIADSENEEVSVMWFVGIDEKYYNTRNLAWYHEKVDLSSYTPDHYKRKYFKDEEIIINSSEDLEKLLKRTDFDKIRCLRVKPNLEKDLRDKNFIKKVGDFSHKHNISILLEGTQLTHFYYQLKNTKANVVCANNDDINYSDTLEFNKLVRDRIPEKIISNGENVKCYRATNLVYESLLLEKLLEESFEVNDAISKEEIISELADVKEICDTILFKIKNMKGSHFDFLKNIKLRFNFDYKKITSFVFKTQMKFEKCIYNNIWYLIRVERIKTLYRIELSLSNYPLKQEQCVIDNRNQNLNIIKAKSKLICMASQSLTKTSNREVVQIIKDILLHINNFCTTLNITISDIEKKQKNKNEINGGFEKGYVLVQTSLLDTDLDRCDEFNPLKCSEISIIEKRLYKYSDFLDDGSGKKRIIMRFDMPIAVNNWEIEFHNEKIQLLLPNVNKIKFMAIKSQKGKLRMDILSLRKEDSDQLNLFDIY